MCMLGHRERDMQGRRRPEEGREEKPCMYVSEVEIIVIETFIHYEMFINQSYLKHIEASKSTRVNLYYFSYSPEN